MKRKSKEKLINYAIFCFVVLACLFAPGCSPVQAAEQPVQQSDVVVVVEEKETLPLNAISVSVWPAPPKPDFVLKIEEQERVVTSLYDMVNEAGRKDLPVLEELQKAAAQAEDKLRRLIRSLSSEEYAVYYRYQR